MPRGRRRSAVVYVHGHIRVDPETSKQDCVDCSADFGESTRPITLEYHLPTPVPRPSGVNPEMFSRPSTPQIPRHPQPQASFGAIDDAVMSLIMEEGLPILCLVGRYESITLISPHFRVSSVQSLTQTPLPKLQVAMPIRGT